MWYKANNAVLDVIELDIVDPDAEGDCMILDIDEGFRGQIVSCDEKYAVSITYLHCFDIVSLLKCFSICTRAIIHIFSIEFYNTPILK